MGEQKEAANISVFGADDARPEEVSMDTDQRDRN